MTAEEWNKKYPVGTKIRYYPIKGIPEYDHQYRESKTRSIAWTLGSGHPIVKIEGLAGGVHLDHLEICE
jgi:hypothetical protein